MKRINVLIVLIFLISNFCISQQEINSYALDSFLQAQSKILLKNNDTSSSAISPDIYDPSFAKDSLINTYYEESLKTYFQYRIFGYQHRQKVFKWQLISSKIIFVIVVLLVVTGIYFSYLQFRKIMHDLPAEKTGENLSTKITLDAKTGGSVDSRVLGVIILFISLMFFYLYLLYVYPIEEIF